MTAKIIKGEDIVLDISVRTDSGDPFDLTGKTAVVKSKVGSTLTTFPTVDIVNAVRGKITLGLSDTETETLKTGFFDFDLYLTEGAETRIVQFRNAVSVVDRLR